MQESNMRIRHIILPGGRALCGTADTGGNPADPLCTACRQEGRFGSFRPEDNTPASLRNRPLRGRHK